MRVWAVTSDAPHTVVHAALRTGRQLMTAWREQLFVVKLISADGDNAAIILDSRHRADICNTPLNLICNYLVFFFVWLVGRLGTERWHSNANSRETNTQCHFAQAPNREELGARCQGWHFEDFGECGFCSFRGMPICTRTCACVCVHVCFILICSFYDFSLHI